MTPAVVLEDSDFIIVDKPAGIPMQPLKSLPAVTLAHLVAERFPEIRKVGGDDWGAVHRLDVKTSGLAVFARNQETYDRLRAMFSKGGVEKEYTALVAGTPPTAGRVEWPIGPDPKTSRKVKVYRNVAEARRSKAQEAVTLFESAGPSLLRILIKTGRRHQIRAHLAAVGHPIVGDALYGGPMGDRLYLHASRLKFRHPRGRGPVEAFSAAPFA